MKNWTGSKEDRADLLFKISKWQKWVVDNKVRDLISNPLSSTKNKKDSLPINKLLQLEDSEELIQAYSNLVFEENSLNKIINILETTIENDRKTYLHRYYAIEALHLYSQYHPIPISMVPLLISHFKGGSYFSAKTCAKLLKKLTNIDVGWEENFFGHPNKLFCNDCEDQIKKWEDWAKVNIIK